MIMAILVVSGILALIALAMPGTIILGLFLGVLPGLLLSVAPGVFAYTAVFAIIRNLIPFGSLGTRGLIAAMLTLALGWLLAMPASVRGKQAYRAALKVDVTPSEQVVLKGHVLVKAAARSTRKDEALGYVPECDGLCAALLDTPGVRSVTIEPADPEKHRAVTYALVQKTEAAAATIVPVRPESVLDDLPEDPANQRAQGTDPLRRVEDRRAWREAYAASWALRTSTRQSITASPARGVYDQVITAKDIRRAPGPGNLRIAEVEISEADRILYRVQHVVGHPIAAPLFPVPDINSTSASWGFARSALRKGPRYGELRPVRLLFENSNLARPEAPTDETETLRAALAAAIRNPGVSPDADTFKLVQPWFKTLKWAELSGDDLDLIEEIIVDPRVTEFKALYDGAHRHVSPQLRDAIARRLLDPRTPNMVSSQLEALVRSMPAGTFKTFSENEKAIIHDRMLRLRSPAYVERLADQGAAAVPTLISILQTDVQGTKWHERWHEMSCIQRALARLGAKASDALPVVHRLFVAKPSPIMNDWSDAQDWRVAMVRMGLPPEQLPFPDHLREEMKARDRENIVKRAAKIAKEAEELGL